mgnify:CR=1 FL=1
MDFDFGSELFEYCIENSIGEHSFENGSIYYDIHINEISKLNSFANIGSCFKGGLIIGNLHSSGGIQIFQPISNEKIRHVGELEGWEYVTSPNTTRNHAKELENINNDIKLSNPKTDTSFNIPSKCKVIDLRGAKHQIIVLTALNHFIINRAATKKHIKKIIELDL